ncbi:MFS transporter [Calidifontibacter sp. DB0510]|uniref:MFS transporter n=1 Tax=Metallococcus carri TaxID=1656884 RepID=A0A967AWN4_9MICO|nr:MFS transporter [Metallococcus carri]NHN54329.1 MFS transporter [Metallococcus carri]NOP36831.1 MFS transporter [Calidifontibacter sp. DB2511S]
MGAGFRWLVASSWTANIGDGIVLAAGPLLVASQTRNAVLVALAAILERLPYLLFGLHAGAFADRWDRRRTVIAADLARACVVLGLCVVIATGTVSIGWVYAALFLAGTAEVFSDSASRTLLPMLVDKADLGIGNARLQAGFLTANQLVGPPIGAFLFAVGHVVPFSVQALAVALGVVLISRIRLPSARGREQVDTHVRQDIVDGIRWLWSNAAVRTLALIIFVFNITWGAAWSVLVLWALDRLHIGTVGYGLLTTMVAIGGLLGTVSYDWLERRVPLATLMRICLTLEVLTHLALALTTIPWVAMVIMVIFGAYAFVWGTLGQTVRQRAVPTEFQGRVGSVYVTGLVAGLLVGQGLGGWIAQVWGLAAPFWFAFVGSGLTLVLVWRQLAHIAHADAHAT